MRELAKNKDLTKQRIVLMTYKQAAERYNLSVSKIRRLAVDSDTLIKIGGSTRIDVEKMDEFVLSFKGWWLSGENWRAET